MQNSAQAVDTPGCVDCLASLLTCDRFVVSLSAEIIPILFECSVAVHDSPMNDLSLPVTVQPEKNSSGFIHTSALFETSQALMSFVTFKNLEKRKKKERLRKMKEEEMEEGEEQTEKAKEKDEPAEFGFGLNVEKMVEGLTHVWGVKLSELADEMIELDEQEDDKTTEIVDSEDENEEKVLITRESA
ncbi:hypothetical protein BLNAU_1530 [Blattamonas nauphoetae]|uniref:Uncharacterized protein n=1 Tax=Blattamonas nauphoetae TaxID=2049346 RepID=A0ABQ9YIA0_9EUKA|nr:hypothetical protein BLNAU_1530 [Blattamonas nauphoetae]